MQIRITQDVQKGCLQLTRGEVLNLPETLAKQYIDAGEAKAVTRAERAVLRRG